VIVNNKASLANEREGVLLTVEKEMLCVDYQAHPGRSVQRKPPPKPLPRAAWINPPETATNDGKRPKNQPTGVSESLTHSALVNREPNIHRMKRSKEKEQKKDSNKVVAKRWSELE